MSGAGEGEVELGCVSREEQPDPKILIYKAEVSAHGNGWEFDRRCMLRSKHKKR
jgi:hypothetical protein